MSVHIDESGHDGQIACIDDPIRQRQAVAPDDVRDPLTLDMDVDMVAIIDGNAVEQTASLDDVSRIGNGRAPAQFASTDQVAEIDVRGGGRGSLRACRGLENLRVVGCGGLISRREAQKTALPAQAARRDQPACERRRRERLAQLHQSQIGRAGRIQTLGDEKSDKAAVGRDPRLYGMTRRAGHLQQLS